MHDSFLSRRPAQILPERESSEYHEWGALGFLIRDIGVIRGQTTWVHAKALRRKGREELSVLCSWCLVLSSSCFVVRKVGVFQLAADQEGSS